MAKSHAQRQKEYRERKKAEVGSKWLEKESKRTVKYYTNVGKLSKREAAKKREKMRVKQAIYRAKKKIETETTDAAENCKASSVNEEEPRPSTSYAIQMDDVSSSTAVTKLVVKLPFASKQKNRSQKKQKQKLKYFEQLKKTLTRKNQALRQALSRLKKKVATSNTKQKSPKTPRSTTEKEMREAGLQPNQHEHIRKKLIFAHCLTNEMRRRVGSGNRKGSENVKRIIAGDILKRYRLTQYAASLVGVRVRSKETTPPQKSQKGIYMKVKEFLEREDNSRQLPGKADAIKNEKKERVQKFVLNDYLRNIFIKFKAEYPNQKISFATFCRARPKHVTLVNYAARITCLCTKHQNFALKLQCLKRYGVTSNTSPDNVSETTNAEEFKEKINAIREQQIEFKYWKRVKCDDGKQRTKLIQLNQTKADFTETAVAEFLVFKEHARRVKEQYKAFKEMKIGLSERKDHVIVQMDFAENYSIKEMEEIQSAYWNPESVTLHPVVMYYNNGTMSHASMVVVSEVLNHNSSMVQAILGKVINWVKEVHPDANYIHYWTDSPTSQYRNKMMFDTVANHRHLYGLNASWHYFEAGHGKGACDGIGGVVKRTADTAIKSGKFNITCGKEFYEWGIQTESRIKYEFIKRMEYEEAREKNDSRQKQINTVKGTLKIHAVVGVNENDIMVRETTCACISCFTADGFICSQDSACGWKRETLSRSKEDTVGQNDKTNHVTNDNISLVADSYPSNDKADAERNQSALNKIAFGDFVAANYDGEIYIGKVLDIDEGFFEVKFMESGTKVKDSLKWPSKEDKLWIEPNDIFCKVDEPISTGKAKRFFKLSEKDRDRINITKQNYNQN